ncbi:4'-phosphopantetheinyl transferase superfamily protein [Halioglobus sp.]|nr:4'-phosphopantetheinyl transferase superfamily protein [Halioglobus sp.]
MRQRDKEGQGNSIQVWIYRPASHVNSRKHQSVVARRLLKFAFRMVNLNISSSILNSPGLDLIQSVREVSGIGVSITHCREMIAVAVATGRGKVGLDCEALGKLRNWQGIAENFFTTMEADALLRADPEQLESDFIKYWTLKEAFVKANKMSIFGGLNHLTVHSNLEVKLRRHGRDYWQVWQSTVDNCAIGLCYQGEDCAAPLLIDCTNLSSGTFEKRASSFVPCTIVK